MSHGSLTRRYCLALILIGVLAIAGYDIMRRIAWNTSSYTPVINRVNDQKALSQQVIAHATAFVQATTPEERAAAKQRLLDAVEAMEQGHALLVRGSGTPGLLGYPSPAISEMFFDGPESLDAIVRDYIQRVRTLVATRTEDLTLEHPDARYVLEDGARKLAQRFEDAIRVHKEEANSRVGRVLASGLVLVGGIWLVLLLEALLIFRPMVKTIDRERAELQRLNAELERLAATDMLTQAFNRRKFAEIIHRESAVARRTRAPMALVLIDVDHFKRFNDAYGHQAGDTILREIALLLRENIRENDYLVRWGGEEFLILAPGTELEGGRTLAEKVRCAVAEHPIEGTPCATISLGVTTMRGDETAEAAIKRADDALYRAKRSGRNQVCEAPSPGEGEHAGDA